MKKLYNLIIGYISMFLFIGSFVSAIFVIDACWPSLESLEGLTAFFWMISGLAIIGISLLIGMLLAGACAHLMTPED